MNVIEVIIPDYNTVKKPQCVLLIILTQRFETLFNSDCLFEFYQTVKLLWIISLVLTIILCIFKKLLKDIIYTYVHVLLFQLWMLQSCPRVLWVRRPRRAIRTTSPTTCPHPLSATAEVGRPSPLTGKRGAIILYFISCMQYGCSLRENTTSCLSHTEHIASKHVFATIGDLKKSLRPNQNNKSTECWTRRRSDSLLCNGQRDA